jgi:hypothetical protein
VGQAEHRVHRGPRAVARQDPQELRVRRARRGTQQAEQVARADKVEPLPVGKRDPALALLDRLAKVEMPDRAEVLALPERRVQLVPVALAAVRATLTAPTPEKRVVKR